MHQSPYPSSAASENLAQPTPTASQKLAAIVDALGSPAPTTLPATAAAIAVPKAKARALAPWHRPRTAPKAVPWKT
eukprot:3533079-Amphidinium_carterae.1